MELKKTAENVKALGKKEKWQLDFDGEHGAVTQLPSEFEDLVSKSIKRIKESALETESKETSVLNNPTAKQEFVSLINRIFLNFVQVISIF